MIHLKQTVQQVYEQRDKLVRLFQTEGDTLKCAPRILSELSTQTGEE